MSRITPEILDVFTGELEKIAISSPQRFIGGAAATLGAMGGLTGATKGYQEARQQGAGVGDAIGAGARSGLRGAALGAGVGAGIGAVGRIPQGVPLIGGRNPGQAIRDFGGHAAHMWTGLGKARNFGGGSAVRQAEFEAIKRTGTAAEVSRAQKALDAMRAIEGETLIGGKRVDPMTLTSIPGAVKAFASNPREAARRAWGAAVHGQTTGQKALMFGLPAAMAVPGIAMAKDNEERGKAIGSAAGMIPSMLMPWTPASMTMMMAPMLAGQKDITPFSPLNDAAMHAGSSVGGAVGRVLSPKKSVSQAPTATVIPPGVPQ